ncbi:MAG: hypothetical protein HY720_27805 [Planctomycetes bacterium]|nr:hypothetical protein [Planctomycetota bacterium]
MRSRLRAWLIVLASVLAMGALWALLSRTVGPAEWFERAPSSDGGGGEEARLPWASPVPPPDPSPAPEATAGGRGSARERPPLRPQIEALILRGDILRGDGSSSNVFTRLEPRAGEAAHVVQALLEEGGHGEEKTAMLALTYYELAAMLGIESTPPVVLEIARAGPPRARAWALQAAARIGDDEGIDAVALALAEPGSPRGEHGGPAFGAAVEAAGLTHEPFLARILEDRLLSGQERMMAHAQAIAAALGAIGDPDSRPVLEMVRDGFFPLELARDGSFSPAAQLEARAALERFEFLHAPDRDQRLMSLVEQVWISGDDFRSDLWALEWMVHDRMTQLAGPVRAIYDARKGRLTGGGAWSEQAVYLDAIRRLGGPLSAAELEFLKDNGRLAREE